MKRNIALIAILICLVIFGVMTYDVFSQLHHHGVEMDLAGYGLSWDFSGIYIKLIAMVLIFAAAVAAGMILWHDYRYEVGIAERLETLNRQLVSKQGELEEQTAIVEELNSQLEDENERYQQQKRTLQAIIDSLGAGIIMVDDLGKIVFVNEEWRNVFDYLDFDENFACEDHFYVSDTSCCEICSFLNTVFVGIEEREGILEDLSKLVGDRERRYAADLEQTRPLKRFLRLYSHPCVSGDGDCFGRVIVVRDISHEKEVERLKLELINTVSHELRTPMSSILGFSELMLTRELSDERVRDYIEVINSEAKRLTDLINKVLPRRWGGQSGIVQ